MSLEGILGRLHALLGLQLDETELVLNVMDHDRLALTASVFALLSRGVGTLQLDILVLALHELLAVALPEDAVDLIDFIVVRENFISGDNVLYTYLRSANFFTRGRT